MVRYFSHGSAKRQVALVAPPPGAKQVGTLRAVTTTNDFLAPGGYSEMITQTRGVFCGRISLV